MSRYIFVIGGVMSSIGKGTTTVSLGRILQSKGFSVTAIKIDPYVNVDAGTMNPIEHGEVFVLSDGTETDQDLGTYERFLDISLDRDNYMTTGSVYWNVIQRERNLGYEGKCVEVIPHIPQEVINTIKRVGRKSRADFVLIEIGGTVGEYQNLLFLEAARVLKLENPQRVLFVLVSYLPIPKKVGEMKTKPTQLAYRFLSMAGIQPDFIVARAEVPLDEPRRRKLSVFCNVKRENIISAPDVDLIYEIPLNFEKEDFGNKVLREFGLRSRKTDLKDWESVVRKMKNSGKGIHIGMIGKYFETGEFVLMDSYISVIEAIKHASFSMGYKPRIQWFSAERIEKDRRYLQELGKMDGVIVPGGFGKRGVEGKIRAIQFCREKKIPFLGLCYGLQLAVIETARHLAGLKKANSTEIDPDTPYPVVDVMPEQKKILKEKRYGGTMRLGDHDCKIKRHSLAFRAYKKTKIVERHRHRYEVNNNYLDILEKHGFYATGINPQTGLVEIMERKDHPFFLGTQFHPEFLSRPLRPHPLFVAFVKASTKKTL